MSSINITTACLSITAILLFSGCNSAKGPQFESFQVPSKDKANLYVYRKTQFFGDGMNLDIYQTNIKTKEEEILPELRPGGYIMQSLTAADYQIWAKTEVKNSINLKVEPNQIYCIQHYITPGFIIGHPQFELQDLSICEPEIRKTKLSSQN